MDGNLNLPSGLTQFVGTAVCDTIGLVIANVDSELKKQMLLPEEYSSIGIIGSRTGAVAQIKAVDDAVKATSTEVISIDLPRDTKGWGGHGNLIILGAKTVADARQAVEIALEQININAGGIYISEAGHMEVHYTPRASYAIQKAFNAPLDKAFGFVCASPAPIGLVIADIALKTANVDIVSYHTPSRGTSHSNEILLSFSGDVSAVKQAVTAARDAGLELLKTLGSEAKPVSKPYF